MSLDTDLAAHAYRPRSRIEEVLIWGLTAVLCCGYFIAVVRHGAGLVRMVLKFFFPDTEENEEWKAVVHHRMLELRVSRMRIYLLLVSCVALPWVLATVVELAQGSFPKISTPGSEISWLVFLAACAVVLIKPALLTTRNLDAASLFVVAHAVIQETPFVCCTEHGFNTSRSWSQLSIMMGLSVVRGLGSRRETLVLVLGNMVFISVMTYNRWSAFKETWGSLADRAVLWGLLEILAMVLGAVIDTGYRQLVTQGLQLAEAREMHKAATALLRSCYDVVVELDSSGALDGDSQDLGSLLLRANHHRSMRGVQMADLIVDEEDRRKFQDRLAASRTKTVGLAENTHVTMKDALGNTLHMEMMWFACTQATVSPACLDGDDDSLDCPFGAMSKFVDRVCILLAKFVRFLFSANIEQYFLYNGLIYIALGVLALVSEQYTYDFLCAKPSEISKGGMGCTACNDILMMCGKTDRCWKLAVNYTKQRDALTPSALFYAERLDSALDTDCIRILESADDPVSMMSGISAEHTSSGGSVPGSTCIAYHCQILLNSLLAQQSPDLVDALGEGTQCSNVYGLKWDGDPYDCTCNSALAAMTLELSGTFQALCGPMAEDLSGQVFFSQMLEASKDPCYAGSAITYYQIQEAATPGYATKAFAVTNCTFLTQAAFSTFEWFTIRNREVQLASTGNTYKFTTPTSCLNDWCNIFNRSLTFVACNWNTDALLQRMTLTNLDDVRTNCPGFDFSTQTVCELTLYGPPFCSSYTPTTTLGGAAVRLLAEPGPIREEPGNPCQNSLSGSCAIARVNPGGALAGSTVGDHLSPSPSVLKSGLDFMYEAADRRLQTPTPSPNNNNLPDFTVSEWSKCICLQQCEEGVRTRSVSCPAGMSCALPKPATSEPCTCGHCADCPIENIIKALEFTYWFQAAGCLTLAPSFFFVSSMTEDDLSEMRFGTKLIGCYCKVLPVLIRIGVYVVLILVLLVNFAVIPGTGFWTDCTSSTSLVLLAISVSAGFVVQLAAGIIVKRRHHVPPWLHNSTADGMAMVLITPLRAIGP